MADQPPEWYDPMQAAYWRMQRKIEQEFLTGVDDMRMGPGKAPKLRAALKGRVKVALKRKRTPFEETLAAVRNEVPKAVRAAVYVAVIVRGGFRSYPYSSRFSSNRNDDGWYSLIGEDKDKLVTEALAKARSFGSHYEVAVGRLDEMVVIPTIFNYETL